MMGGTTGSSGTRWSRAAWTAGAAVIATLLVVSIPGAHGVAPGGTAARPSAASAHPVVGPAGDRKAAPARRDGAATSSPAPVRPAALGPGGYVPDLRVAAHDLTQVHRDGCMVGGLQAGIRVCGYGDPHGRITAILVGDSHSVHWFPALNRIAKDRGWRLVTILKAGCRFSATTPGRDAKAESCRAWVGLALDRIRRNPPDILITMATKSRQTREYLPDGYVTMWRRLNRLGIPVIGIRDTPRAPFNRVRCLLDHPDRPARCAIPRNPTLDPVSPFLRRDDIPPNVAHVDMSDHLCSADSCPAVRGTLVIYRDNHHFTGTFSRRIARRLDPLLPSPSTFGAVPVPRVSPRLAANAR